MRRTVLSLVAMVSAAACGDDGGGGAREDAAPIDTPAPVDAAIDAVDAPPPIDAALHRDVRCGDPAPADAILPPPPPAYSGAMCPTLVPGHNLIETEASMRDFVLVVPSDYQPGRDYPLFFFWHELGGSADSIVNNGQVQDAADRLQIIAVVPETKGDLVFTIPFVDPIDMGWPYLTVHADRRLTEEVTFFDDVFACVTQQYDIDTSCVATAGVSAGGLWTSQLIQRRGQFFSSALVISGGVGPATGISAFEVRGWTGGNRAVPALVAWGGANDTCAANFDDASHNLEAGLVAGGHFVLECIHNCGHGAPPVDPAVGLPALYAFALDHPYWLRAGESPYYVRPLPEGTPAWCALGAGNATPRTGTCDPPVCPIPAL